jgi:cytidylate kinase
LRKLVIAIDGPAASGKSTTAKVVAEKLDYIFVDTGAMYRAMTLKVLKESIEVNDSEQIAKLAVRTSIRLERSEGSHKVFLDGEDVTMEIRNRKVTNAVSAVSSIKKVREVMVREQRRMGAEGGIVLEGRDIGTVVFPDADVKIFMIANAEERARRRQRDLVQQGVHVSLDELKDEITVRDKKDSDRDVSPLRKADDAIILDTSNLTVDQQVEFIITKVQEVLSKREKKKY